MEKGSTKDIIGPGFCSMWGRSNNKAPHNIHHKRRLSGINYYLLFCSYVLIIVHIASSKKKIFLNLLNYLVRGDKYTIYENITDYDPFFI